jgi:hypothetical protein
MNLKDFFKKLLLIIPLATIIHFLVYFLINLFNDCDYFLFFYFSEHMGGEIFCKNQYCGEDNLTILSIFIIIYIIFEIYVITKDSNLLEFKNLLKSTSIRIIKIIIPLIIISSIILSLLWFPIWISLIAGFLHLILLLLFNFLICLFLNLLK